MWYRERGRQRETEIRDEREEEKERGDYDEKNLLVEESRNVVFTQDTQIGNLTGHILLHVAKEPVEQK